MRRPGFSCQDTPGAFWISFDYKWWIATHIKDMSMPTAEPRA